MMEELIAVIARSLVDQPDAVKVTRTDDEDSVTIELAVAPEDLGKVIGKQGRTARALRSILAAAAEKVGKRSRLEILE
ncbi:MAG: KH domain-containing protein [Desulforhopalus sp.]